ncbi:MAG: NAD(P)/FAD-dependent oxidoreductase [Candidatus Nomurabacteria bacterium]|nr:NAD(P)/FAD-dependent oxidoreductase [Candidatus Nomurabacteria bacterium]
MKLNTENFDVIVIGGGASGMMAAGVAAQKGKKVLILEKNKNLGEKLKITGGGRCNVTNAESNIKEFLKIYGEDGKFLHSAFSKFSSKDSFEFFESRGLPLVVQARKRAFPNTEKAIDVFNVLNTFLIKNNVKIKTNCGVKKILSDKDSITGLETKDGIFTAKSYILATGGLSHPETGSTGDGFKWLADLGHKVKSPTPTIVPLAVEENWIKMLSGISLSFMKITFYVDGKKSFKETGKILFTHFGLSGPLILNSAGKVSKLLHEGLVTALIDAYPDTDHGPLEKKIIKIFDANKNKTLKNVFKDIVPEGTAPGIITLLPQINFETKVHSITKEERKLIVDLLKALPVTITELMGYDRAVVADGGVDLREIDTRTMRSLKKENLFVTGDLLNVNKRSGGYPLQLCWTTGFVAGENA